MKTNILVCSALWGDINSKYIQYLPQYSLSLAAQEQQPDKVVFFVSGNLENSVKNAFNKYAPNIELETQHLNAYDRPIDNLTAAAQRFAHCAKLSNEFPITFLQDPDDCFPSDYIKEMVKTIETDRADIALADLNLCVNGKITNSAYLTPKFPARSMVSWQNILHENPMGWSNTALKTELLGDHIPKFLNTLPEILAPAGDWSMYFSLMACGAKTVRSETALDYNQHAENISGITRTDDSSILKALRLKSAFYENLLKANLPEDIHQQVNQMAIQFKHMQSNISSNNEHAFEEYKKNKVMPHITSDKNMLWWAIAPP